MRLASLCWYALTAIILIGVGAAVVRSGGSAPRTPQQMKAVAPADADEPQSRLIGAMLIEQAQASPAWEVYADEAALYEGTQTAVAQGVRAEMFRDHQTLLWLQADQGEVSRASGNIAVQGDVRLQHQAGYTIRTEALDWQADSHMLTTDKPVQIQGPAVRVTGTGMRSDVDQQRFSLQRDVHASFQLRTGPPPVDKK
ncbi:MAG: LPS export ABC transporter periplasmic protein LptC [Candidatus Tectomicrobia bacterium]|nr:LPS export ABC transporter periplasmic protein LptC [Candidatus Tectomicrobia bacterium]